MTEQEFRNSAYRDELHVLLNKDSVKAALALIERKPDMLPQIQGIHHTDAVVARMYAHDSGINHAVTILKRLAEPWVDQTEMAKASERPMWGDHIPAEIRQAFEKYQKETNQTL